MGQRQSTIATFIAAIVLGAMLVGCTSVGPAPIVLGAVYNTSGAQAVLDVPSSYGSDLAVKEINARDGVLGRSLKVAAVDGNSQADALGRETETLLSQEPDVIAMLGLSDTDMVLAAAPVAAAHDLIFLTSGATSPKLPDQVPGSLFLACFGDNVQAAAAAEWAHDQLDAHTAMVLFDPGESYTSLLQGYFVDRFEGLGGTISAVEEIDPRADNLDVPQPGDVDLVFLSVQTAEDALRVVPVLRAAGYSGPIVGGDGYDAQTVWAQAPTIANVYFTTHVYLGADNPDPAVAAFSDAYAKAFPGQDASSFAALGYDAVGLLAAALERAGRADASGVQDGLAGLEEYHGVTGSISYPGDARIPKKSVTIVEVDAGSLRFVAQVLPEVVPDP